MNTKLDTPIQYLKGVGPKLAKIFKKVGVETVFDLIYFFPRDYEDRTQLVPIGKLQPTNFVVVKGEVLSVDHQLTRNRFSILKVKLADKTGKIQAIFFNQPYLSKMFRPGMKLIVAGKVDFSDYEGVLQLTVKDYEIDLGDNPKIVPLYPLTEGLYPKKVRAVVQIALEECLPLIKEYLPAEIVKQYKLADLIASIRELHFPTLMAKVLPARDRLAFDDFFVYQLGLGLRHEQVKKEPGIAFKIEPAEIDEFKKYLPFQLTNAQEKVLSEIITDMRSSCPMNRLVQGDVGSGKTVLAAAAAYFAIKNGYQAAIMAPTEILAQQHYEKLRHLLENFGLKAMLLTSTTRKRPTMDDGRKNNLFIGTHALIQTEVKYDNLGLIVIDEQHRFGVRQRVELAKKGVNPDILVMTATPIPRSLALTIYGDLDRSIVAELPPGRTPIKTHYVPENKRKGAYDFMRSEMDKGRQIYVICPLVAESEKVDLKAAQDEAARLQKDIFPDYKVGLLHGRLKSEEKEQIMGEFKDGKINILVSTTVIEVGIDIPNATVMVIEQAERFGLSQLHQLRGRIGRGSEQSYCFLIAETKTDDAKVRIKALLDSNDGFKIAEADLKLRGPGEFYGTRQSGLPNFRVADIIRDEKILKEARAAAWDLIAANKELASNIWNSQGKKIKSTDTGAPLN
jgi:ATP-dependent DNA helicase RecG